MKEQVWLAEGGPGKQINETVIVVMTPSCGEGCSDVGGDRSSEDASERCRAGSGWLGVGGEPGNKGHHDDEHELKDVPRVHCRQHHGRVSFSHGGKNCFVASKQRMTKVCL